MVNSSSAKAHLSQRYACWSELAAHSQQFQPPSLGELYTQEYQLSTAGLHLDYSRHFIDKKTLALFETLGEQAKVPQAIDDLLTGKPVNHTENRPAWHTALRSKTPLVEVADCLQRMETIVDAVRSGRWLGYSGKPIADVVNIGIGGSDLGPRMVSYALHDFLPASSSLRCHFVSNIDPLELTRTVSTLNPETTLFIVASKSFITLETLANAKLARQWLLQNISDRDGADISQHFIAVSSAVEKAQQFGIAEQNILPLWDWVGGRYSLWSAIGLSIALDCGMEAFKALLKGAQEMDQHFSEAPLSKNMPVLLAMLEFWYSQFFEAQTHAVLPYSHALKLLPEFLQQLTMESNGKQVNNQGEEVTYPTGSVLWGVVGSMGQHSFHQLFHQGTQLVPIDFILPLHANTEKNKGGISALLQDQQAQLVANCLAQSEALLAGKNLAQVQKELSKKGCSEEEVQTLAAHQVIPGSRPHSIISCDAVTPETLGALLALYEHKTYVHSVLLNINAFDQWGVELGKQLSQPIYEGLVSDEEKNINPRIELLINRYRHLQK